MENLIILGTGPAGLTAALYAARANLEPLVYEGGEPGGQLTTTTDVENYPGFESGVMGPDLVDIMRKQAQRFGTRCEYGKVVSTDLSGPIKKLTLENGEVKECKALIIATGATAKYLGLESEQKLLSVGGGVSACAVCDGAFYKGVPVCVIGGGDTAMEEAVFLTKYASKVYIIHRRDEFRASKIMAERALKNEKIEPVWNSVIEEVNDVEKGVVTGIRVKNVLTDELRDIAVEGYFSAIGHKPNTDPFVGQLDMDSVGYLIADHTKTNIPGVYAAGDVQDSVYRQAVTAAGSGCMAALEAEKYLESLHD
ncbi:MAG: thioredoxin reductase (NADPH) [Candidatus Omnitrophota bacterium]|jgi:thioredoxin reductase (NADPH)